jgi:transcriptional antiterminator RfaH
MNWYVVYTKPKWEIKVAEQLKNLGVTCYCPTVIKERQWSDRKKKINVPLFNQYVFVQLEDRDRNLVFLSPGVVRYLYWLDKYAIVRKVEIETIKNWLNPVEKLSKDIEVFRIGDTIEIKNGPFVNKKAYLKDITNTQYVLVLESLGYILRISNKENIME